MEICRYTSKGFAEDQFARGMFGARSLQDIRVTSTATVQTLEG